MFTDSHCHLADPKYLPDFEEVMLRARLALVDTIIAIGAGDGMAGNERVCELAEKYEGVYAAVGIHPHDTETVSENYIELLKTTLPLPPPLVGGGAKYAFPPPLVGGGEGEGKTKVVAIGEMGLDYHYLHSSREAQQHCFREQLKLAQELNLPVIIHSREAWEDTVRLVRATLPPRRGVFHCFGGTLEEAHQAIDLGFYISVSGIITFGKKTETLQQVVRETPLEHLLIETDAPWLAPVPHRGKRNEPAFVVKAAEKIAELKGVSLETVGQITTDNAKKLFGLPQRGT